MKNFGFMRGCGVIMSVSSLPSKYGIGSFGRSAYDFVDFLAESGQRYWQVLPLNPTAYGDSPYQSPASVAGNPYFIDLDLLQSEGLLTKGELLGHRMTGDRVDYGRLFGERYAILRIAYSRFSGSREYNKFVRENQSWLDDYALFMALKVKNGYVSFVEWCESERDYKKAVLKKCDYESEMSFWKFLQFEFFSQWKLLKAYAKKKKITVIGDLPIYVAHDSMDVWRSPEEFCLNEYYNPKEVAGCPPDAFSEDGQLWGNPIYNWDYMKSQGFSWWCERIERALELYDIVRIDHFRGFAGYYSIPYGESTARCGRWNSAPGKELFSKILEAVPGAKIIAEDLGYITDDVRELLSFTGFAGMKMLHFAFDCEESEYLPRKYVTDNTVVYASSHDSECTASWVKSLSAEVKSRFDRECPRVKGQSRTYDLILLAHLSRANLSMVLMQDYLGLTSDEGRMNTPSKSEGNWAWRISPRYRTSALKRKMLALAKRGKRA